ncbi:hypothetical protein [Marinibactrum halimedae]|uniref:CdiA C-terminal tRNase domain-containing protein n=1 Tax=Marinibactrum halimedae TaxID=1444977 RepID=A0AA37WKN6_9GAMM|nr:hypothetical protein [Marinibactrum halimedae]MCD9461000.1 hypothetical protein [Marinibactrum halimedae]GLS24769.1 hypothetical protein GCM10007877_04830 [Marinibactrum halimedae]
MACRYEFLNTLFTTEITKDREETTEIYATPYSVDALTDLVGSEAFCDVRLAQWKDNVTSVFNPKEWLKPLDMSSTTVGRSSRVVETIGAATRVGTGSNNPQQSLADLNRDIAIAQEITRDDEENTDLYATSTAVESIGNLVGSDDERNQRLNTWRGNVASVVSPEAWGQVAENATHAVQDLSGVIGQVASNDTINGADGFHETLDGTHRLTLLNHDLTRTADGRALLNALENGTDEERLAANQEIGQRAQARFGIDPTDINFYNASETESTSLQNTALAQTMGAVVTDDNHEQRGNVFINVENAENAADLANTLGHEVYESVTEMTGGDNDAEQEAIANVIGAQLSRRLNGALSGSLADIGLEGASDTDIARAGTERSHDVGNAQVDYRQFTHYEAGMLDEARAVINNNTSLNREERFEQLNRLNALACAEVRCAAGVSENDDFYDILTDLQREGEALKKEQGADILQTLAALDVDTTYVIRSGRSSNEHDGFQYGVGDATNDIISSNEQIVARGVQAGQVVAGTLEVTGATGLCTTGVGCTVGAALGTVGAMTLAEGVDGLSKEHEYQSGERVVDSFSLEDHQGSYNPTVDAVAEVLVNVAGGAAGRVAGRLGDDVVDALPSFDNLDVRLEGNVGDSVGARADAELGELPERSVIPRREPEVDQAAKNPSSDAEELSRNQLYPEAEAPHDISRGSVELNDIQNLRRTDPQSRIMELAQDPDTKKLRSQEAQTAFEIEEKYGYFDRYKRPSPDAPKGDFISLSGPYKGQTFDDFGSEINEGMIRQLEKKPVKTERKFFESLEKHLEDADNVILNLTVLKSKNNDLYKRAMKYIDSHELKDKIIDVTKGSK